MFKRKSEGASPSIVRRVTIWYSIFLFLMVLALIGLVFVLSASFSDTESKRELLESATEMVQSPSEYENFDDGIYYSIYDALGQLTQASFPSGFDSSLPLTNGNVQEINLSGTHYLYLDLPYVSGQGWLRAVMYSSHSGSDNIHLILAVVLVSPALLLLIIAGGYWILKRALNPVDQLTHKALAIQESGDLSQRLPVTTQKNELGRLALVLNGMLDSLEKSFEKERQFNNDLSHELRTPLAVILSESEYGLRYADSLEEAQESFQVVNRQAKRMKGLTEQILELAKFGQMAAITKEELNLSELLATSGQDFQKLCQERGILLETDIRPNVVIQGDSLLLQRLMDNLFSNALKFTKDKIILSLRQEGSGYRLSFWNNGPAISPEETEKIWQRFYQLDQARTKTEMSGSGLGLALVEQIAKLHQAEIGLSSGDAGTEFTIIFPKI